MADKISKAGTVTGYSFKQWLKGTKESIKTVVMAGVGIGTYFLAASSLSPELQAGLATLAAAAAKWLLDFLDFWLSDVSLSPISPP